MVIKVLGTGCAKCNKLESNVKQAVEELQLNAEVVKEQDIMKIMGYGINRTPGLVVDGRVVMNGRVPGVNQIKELLTQKTDL